MNSAACSDGCVIEHAGDISWKQGEHGTRPDAWLRNRPYCRPPTDWSAGGIWPDRHGNNPCQQHRDCRVRPKQQWRRGYSRCANCGYAWMEIDQPGGRLYARGHDYPTDGFFYEIVNRQYFSGGANGSDRGGARSAKYDVDVLVVGSIITGDDSPTPAHADTWRIYYTSRRREHHVTATPSFGRRGTKCSGPGRKRLHNRELHAHRTIGGQCCLARWGAWPRRIPCSKRTRLFDHRLVYHSRSTPDAITISNSLLWRTGFQ